MDRPRPSPSREREVALERSTNAGGDKRAPVGIAGLPVRFSLRRIRKDGRGELRHPRAAADQVAGKADQITRLRRHDGATDDAAALVMHPQEPPGLIVEHAAIDLRQRYRDRLNVFLSSVSAVRREADVRDLWVCVRAPRNGERARLPAAEKERIWG